MSKNNNDDNNNSPVKDKDYEVGYGKPPKSGQFKKGQSGNPMGRPKKTAKEDIPLVKIFKDELDTLSHIIDKYGEAQPITRKECFFRQLIIKAANGNIEAMRLLVRLITYGKNFWQL